MRVMKWSMIALAVSAGTSQFAMASAQDDSKGFIEDSTASILTRALYFSRDRRNHGAEQSRIEETGLGFHGLFSSGYTQGTIGVGVDVIGCWASSWTAAKAVPAPVCSQRVPTAVRRMTTPKAAQPSSSVCPIRS